MLEKTKINDSIMRLANSHFLYKLDESLIWLFNTETGEYWNLNEPSHFVLSLFDGKRTISEICQLYVERYLRSGVGKELLMEDFKSMLNQFITAKVLAQKEKGDEQELE